MKSKTTITSILLFIALSLGALYISIFSENGVENKVGKISILGSRLLSADQYLEFTRLNKSSEYVNYSLAVIKDRFEKHPYVEKVNVKFGAQNEVIVELQEKKFEAIVLDENGQYLVTEDFIVEPLFPFTKSIDLPVIENPVLPVKLRGNDEIRTADMKSAFKIIESARAADKAMYGDLSDIDMRNGKDILLKFKSFDSQVIFGRNNEVEKMFYFGKIWNRIQENKETAGSFIDYVDLRFDKLIYVGAGNLATEVKGIKG